jgi:hypothetical protein
MDRHCFDNSEIYTPLGVSFAWRVMIACEPCNANSERAPERYDLAMMALEDVLAVDKANPRNKRIRQIADELK